MKVSTTIKVIGLLAGAFMLSACGDTKPHAQFKNLDLDTLQDVKDMMSDVYNSTHGYLYNTETGEISLIAMDDYNNTHVEPRFFIKSLTHDDDVLSQHFQSYAKDFIEEVENKAKEVVDQDGNYTTAFLYYDIEGLTNPSFHDDKASEKLDVPHGSLECFTNNADAEHITLIEPDEENDVEGKFEYKVPGTCLTVIPETKTSAAKPAKMTPTS